MCYIQIEAAKPDVLIVEAFDGANIGADNGDLRRGVGRRSAEGRR